MKRVFLIVLDSVGIGEMPDANLYGDVGSNTLKSCSKSKYFNIINMKKLGLFNIDGVNFGECEQNPIGSFARMKEAPLALSQIGRNHASNAFRQKCHSRHQQRVEQKTQTC